MKTAFPAVVLAMLLAIPIVAVSQQAGQNPTSVSPQTDDLPRHSDIVVGVNYVVAPTTVLDKSGNFVNGLNLSNFTLFDNDKPQKIVQDVVFQPISMVVAVQTNSVMEQMLPKVQKMGAVLQTLVLGESGEMS